MRAGEEVDGVEGLRSTSKTGDEMGHRKRCLTRSFHRIGKAEEVVRRGPSESDRDRQRQFLRVILGVEVNTYKT